MLQRVILSISMVMSLNASILQQAFLDKNTNLMWQDNTAVKTKQLKWNDAKNYCSSLSISGYDDWRLPSYDELKTLIDYKRYDPAIIKVFKYTASSYYWSSTVYASGSSQAWYINFESGDSYYYDKSSKRHVRCVRGKVN